MSDFESFNASLYKRLSQDFDRIHYEKNQRIQSLWLEEQSSLLCLPEADYPVFKEIIVTANRYNEIKLDKERIHVPRVKNHSIIYAILRFDSYQLISANGEIIDAGPRPYMNKKRAIHWASILLDWQRKPRAMHYSRYWKYLPGRIQLYLSDPDWKIQNTRLDQLQELLVTHDMQGIDTNFYELLGHSERNDAYDVNWDDYDAILTPTVEEVMK